MSVSTPTRNQLLRQSALAVIRTMQSRDAHLSDSELLERHGQVGAVFAEAWMQSVGQIVGPELDRLYGREDRVAP